MNSVNNPINKMIPYELIREIFEFADIKCMMCHKELDIRYFYRWGFSYYSHKKCIEEMEFLLL